MNIDSFAFTGFNSDRFTDPKTRREMVVQAALVLLNTEAAAGIRVDIVDREKKNDPICNPLTSIDNKDYVYNPVKQYADWIEEALEIPKENDKKTGEENS